MDLHGGLAQLGGYGKVNAVRTAVVDCNKGVHEADDRAPGSCRLMYPHLRPALIRDGNQLGSHGVRSGLDEPL